MFAIQTFFSMLFVKCKSRGEQAGLVVGMLILVVACYGIGKFFLGLGEAGAETMHEFVDNDLGPGRGQDGLGQITLFGYGSAAICGLVGVLFGLIGLINAVRFLTGTGLADPDESW